MMAQKFSIGGKYMTNERTAPWRKVYSILLSVSIAVAGVCLILACLGIYRSGDRPFSREAVAAAFSPIALPVYLCLALVIGSFLLNLILPEAKVKLKVTKNPAMLLKIFRSKVDLAKCSQELQSALLAEAGKRRKNRCITGILLAIGGAIFFYFALQQDAFHQSQINGSMIRNISILGICLAPAFLFSIFAAYQGRKSMDAEIALLKTVPAEAKIAAPAAPAQANRLVVIRTVITVAAIACLIYGFCTGGTADVLTKAVNICTECVGLG